MNVSAVGQQPFGMRLIARLGWVKEVLSLLAAGALGAGLAVASWGPGRSPALALLLPLLWLAAPNRGSAFVLTTAYHLGVVRFLPDFAGVWFGSPQDGYVVWIASCMACGVTWALFWTSRLETNRVVVAMAGVLLATILPPVAMVLPGHPIVGMGYLAPRTGWVGVVFFVVGECFLAWALRVRVARMGKRPLVAQGAVILGLGAVLALAGGVPDPEGGRVIGNVGAIDSRWGPYPQRGSLEVMQRIGQIGLATSHLAGGEGEIKILVLPEAVLGLYDPSLFPAIQREILRRTRVTGQTVVVGADLETGNDLQKAALVFRPDGTSSFVVARQPVPIAEWAPWKKRHSYPIGWLGTDTVALGDGIVGRVTFCYEEYIPALHLLSEWRGKHNLIIVMANLWASKDPLTNSIQAAHTEGIARLFGRPWIRAVNFAKPS